MDGATPDPVLLCDGWSHPDPVVYSALAASPADAGVLSLRQLPRRQTLAYSPPAHVRYFLSGAVRVRSPAGLPVCQRVQCAVIRSVSAGSSGPSVRCHRRHVRAARRAVCVHTLLIAGSQRLEVDFTVEVAVSSALCHRVRSRGVIDVVSSRSRCPLGRVSSSFGRF